MSLLYLSRVAQKQNNFSLVANSQSFRDVIHVFANGLKAHVKLLAVVTIPWKLNYVTDVCTLLLPRV